MAQQRAAARVREPPASPLSESNRRHQPYHGCALPTELRGPGCCTSLEAPVPAAADRARPETGAIHRSAARRGDASRPTCRAPLPRYAGRYLGGGVDRSEWCRCGVRHTFVNKLLKSDLEQRRYSDAVLVERLIVEGDSRARRPWTSIRGSPCMGGMPPTPVLHSATLLAGALHGTARGVHAEVVDDSGRRLVVLRPGRRPAPRDRRRHGRRRHRAVPQLRRPRRPAEQPVRPARRSPASRADDLRNRTPRNDAVRTLSAVDQVALWGAADAVLDRAPDGQAPPTPGGRSPATSTSAGPPSTAPRSRPPPGCGSTSPPCGRCRRARPTCPTTTPWPWPTASCRSSPPPPTPAGTRPPVLLDETFDQLEPAVVPLLLELLPGPGGRPAGHAAHRRRGHRQLGPPRGPRRRAVAGRARARQRLTRHRTHGRPARAAAAAPPSGLGPARHGR